MARSCAESRSPAARSYGPARNAKGARWLRQLVPDATLRALWQRVNAATKPFEGIACPSCQRSTAVINMPTDDAPVELVEVCRGCSMVWFDANEPEALPKRPPPKGPDDGLTPEQREMLAIAEVQKMARQQRLADEADPSLSPSRWPAVLGLPVELHGVQFGSRPWATWTVAAVVAMTSAYGFYDDTFFKRWQLVANALGDSLGLTLLSSFFLHGDWFHLLSNLWFLAVFGDDIEDRLGRQRWVTLLFGATLLGGVLQVTFDPRGDMPSVGASGGISGLIACYALLLPEARLGVFVRLHWVTFSARTGFVLWLLLQGWLLVEQLYGHGYVSALDHLGGVLVGVLAWAVWRERMPG